MRSIFRWVPLALSLVMVFSVWSPTHAELSAVGPIDPVRNFPLWYEDTNGLQLQLCLEEENCFFEPVISDNETSEQVGFGSEAYYWFVDAFIDTGNGQMPPDMLLPQKKQGVMPPGMEGSKG